MSRPAARRRCRGAGALGDCATRCWPCPRRTGRARRATGLDRARAATSSRTPPRGRSRGTGTTGADRPGPRGPAGPEPGTDATVRGGADSRSRHPPERRHAAVGAARGTRTPRPSASGTRSGRSSRAAHHRSRRGASGRGDGGPAARRRRPGRPRRSAPTRASGTTMTRAPASRARQQRSSARAPGSAAASKPPSSANRSARINRHASLTKKTSRTASCCSWSSSSDSISEWGTPKRSMDQPTSRRISGRSGSTILGPRTAALDRYASSTSTRIASASHTTSSWQNSRNGAPATVVSASLAATAQPPAATGRTNAVGRVRRDPRREVLGARPHDDDGQIRVVGRGQSAEAPVQVAAPLADDHDGHHGRGRRCRLDGLGGHLRGRFRRRTIGIHGPGEPNGHPFEMVGSSSR